MYLKFGNFDSAQYLFDEMPDRDVVSWNTIVSGYVKAGLHSEAVQLFHKVWVEGIEPDGFMVVSLVNACDRSGTMVAEGVQVHGLIVKVGLLCNVYVGTAFVHFYGTYGFLSDALRVFEEMPEMNTVSWTCLMVAYSSNNDAHEVVRIFRRMCREGISCNQSSFSTVISSCGLLGDDLLGLQVLARIILYGFDSNVSVANSLISMFGSFGNIEAAKYIFDWMVQRDTISWNSIISTYSLSQLCEESLRCFHWMRSCSVKPNSTTLSSLVYACRSADNFNCGMGIHALAFKFGLDSSACFCTTLVTLYSEMGRCKDAELLFREISEKDLISWNSMIASYVQNGKFSDVLRLMVELHAVSRIRDEVTVATVLAACSCPESLNDGKVLHALSIRAGLHEDILVGNSLVTMYGNCGEMGKAESVFCTMPVRDGVTWNALIAGYSENKEPQQAIKVFKLMKTHDAPVDYITMVNILSCSSTMADLLNFGMPIHSYIVHTGFEQNSYVQNTLLTMYAKCGDLASTNIIFDKLDLKSVVSFNAVVAANAHHGRGEVALKHFIDMHNASLQLDCISFSGSLVACANLVLLEEGRQIHNLIIKIGFESDLHVKNALMDMYGKSGEIGDVLHLLPIPEKRSHVSWNILISAFSRHGYCKEAKETFQHMLQFGQKPDEITFISLLSAFSHGGLVDEGLSYFTRMASEFLVLPGVEHCACIVDLLGRSGRLTDAENFIEKMHIPPDDLIWRSLLSACKTHNNVELGIKAATHLLELDSSDDSAYILLSNAYAVNGRWNDMEQLRRKIEMCNINKPTGCSWVSVAAI